MHRHRLTLEPRQLPFQVGEEHVRHVVREATPHDDPQGGEILPVLGERVRRYLPAPLAECVRDVEDGEVLDVVTTLNAKTGSSSPRVISSKGPSSSISLESPVATSRA